MEITEPRRLYQQLAADLKERIEQGVYLVGDKLPAERFIADEKNVSRTVVREAIIMLEVEGYNIKRADSKRVLELVNALIEDSDSKKTTKAILKTFVDRITFDKESKSDFKIYMTFDQLIIDRLNEFMSSEPTAETHAVGSFVLSKILKITV